MDLVMRLLCIFHLATHSEVSSVMNYATIVRAGWTAIFFESPCRYAFYRECLWAKLINLLLCSAPRLRSTRDQLQKCLCMFSWKYSETSREMPFMNEEILQCYACCSAAGDDGYRSVGEHSWCWLPREGNGNVAINGHYIIMNKMFGWQLPFRYLVSKITYNRINADSISRCSHAFSFTTFVWKLHCSPSYSGRTVSAKRSWWYDSGSPSEPEMFYYVLCVIPNRTFPFLILFALRLTVFGHLCGSNHLQRLMLITVLHLYYFDIRAGKYFISKNSTFYI